MIQEPQTIPELIEVIKEIPSKDLAVDYRELSPASKKGCILGQLDRRFPSEEGMLLSGGERICQKLGISPFRIATVNNGGRRFHEDRKVDGDSIKARLINYLEYRTYAINEEFDEWKHPDFPSDHERSPNYHG